MSKETRFFRLYGDEAHTQNACTTTRDGTDPHVQHTRNRFCALLLKCELHLGDLAIG